MKMLAMACLLAGTTQMSEAGLLNKREWVKPYQHAYSFNGIEYLLYIPPSYVADVGATKRFPLLVNFHASGQKGRDASVLQTFGLAAHLADPAIEPFPIWPLKGVVPREAFPALGSKREDFPFIVITPQLPGKPGFEVPYAQDRGTWYPDDFLATVYALVQHVAARYDVDASRIYGQGASMGGYGLWRMAVLHPNLFAAISPQCGVGEPEYAYKLRKLPIWIFHPAADNIIPPMFGRAMQSALAKVGAKEVKYTDELYASGMNGFVHDNTHPACLVNDYEELYPWFLSHQNKSKGKHR